MKNLRRYDFALDMNVECNCDMRHSGDGDWVKFSDIKDILKPSHNKSSPKLPPLEEVEHDVFSFYVSQCMNGDLGPSTRRVIRDTYNFIVRQLSDS